MRTKVNRRLRNIVVALVLLLLLPALARAQTPTATATNTATATATNTATATATLTATATPTATPCGTLVQAVSGTTRSCSAAFPATSLTPSIGDLLVVNVNTTGTGVTPASITVSDTQGNLFRANPNNTNSSVCSSSTINCVAQFATIATANTADVVTANIGTAGSGSCAGIVTVTDLSGSSGTAMYAESAWGSSGFNTTQITGTTASGSHAQQIVVGMVGVNPYPVSSDTIGPSSGPTQYGTAGGTVASVINVAIPPTQPLSQFVGWVNQSSAGSEGLQWTTSLNVYSTGLIGAWACEGAATPTPTVTATATATSTPTATATATSTGPTPTATATATATPTVTASATATNTATATATATLTATPTPTATAGCPLCIGEMNPTSLWVPPTSGNTIPDSIDSNPLTIAGDSNATLMSNNSIYCNTQSQSGVGCDLPSSVPYSNAQPMSVLMAFSGTGGPLAQFGGQPSISTFQQYYELYLDTFGRLTFGAFNYGNLNVLQNQQHATYADGNEHIAVATIGSSGMNLYADGSKVGSQNSTLSNYGAGYWLFGGAGLTGASPSGNTWPYAPPTNWFNGTLYCMAWWNGTQLTDQQAESATLSKPITPIANNYATLTGSIASLVQGTGYAYANQPVTFKTQQSQGSYLPGCGSQVGIAPSEMTYTTDSYGNLPSGVQIPQGAHVTMQIASGPPTPLIISCQNTVDIWDLVQSQTSFDPLVDAVAVAGPLFAGTTVTNPGPGQIGTATITAPGSQCQNAAGGTVLNIANGNIQCVNLAASSTITLENMIDGQQFTVDVVQNPAGGYSPTFVVPSGYTLVWSGGGSQPASSTAPNTYTQWSFTTYGTTVQGALIESPTGGNTFTTLNVTSGINDTGRVTVSGITANAPTVTVMGTAGSTTYSYAAVCNDGNGGSTTASPFVSVTNGNATLSGTNYNTIAVATEQGCQSWTILKTNTSTELGTINSPTGSLNDTGQATTTYTGPTINTTGELLALYLSGNLTTLTAVGDLLSENAALQNIRVPGPVTQLAAPAAPTITTSGTAGSTTYTYYLVCHDRYGGSTVPSGAGSTGTGNASLSASNYNVVTIPGELGCTTWDVLSPDTAHSVALAVPGPTFNDMGAGNSPYTTPTLNTTAADSYLFSSPNTTAVPTVPNVPSWQSPLASEIPGFDNVTVTGIPGQNYLPIATGPNTASWQLGTQITQLIAHGLQCFTANGTFTVPANVFSMFGQCWGAGGGGGGYGSGDTNGSGGTATTIAFGLSTVCGAQGGSGGQGAPAGSHFSPGGAGGAAGAGPGLNIAGGGGFNGLVSVGSVNGAGTGGVGGGSPGVSNGSYGSGGAGGGGGGNGGGGGGGGAYNLNQFAVTPGGTITATLGTGGAAGTGGTDDGNAGLNGVACVEW